MKRRLIPLTRTLSAATNISRSIQGRSYSSGWLSPQASDNVKANADGSTTEPLSGWLSPQADYVKANVNGSTTEPHRKDGQLGAGGILRDGRAEPYIAFMMRCGRGDIEVAESICIIRMMELALSLGHLKLIILSARLNVINALTRNDKSGHKLSGWTRYRYEMLVPRFEDFLLEHVNASENKIAKHLALMGRQQTKIIRCLEDIDDENKCDEIAQIIQTDIGSSR